MSKWRCDVPFRDSLIYLFPEADLAVAAANRTTTPYMTKYERARVLGTRALQIR